MDRERIGQHIINVLSEDYPDYKPGSMPVHEYLGLLARHIQDKLYNISDSELNRILTGLNMTVVDYDVINT